MAGFITVGDVVVQVRGILQDDDGERWLDPKVYQTLNMGMIEARRLRPDLFRGQLDHVPQYDPVSDVNTPIGLDQQYIPALVLYTAGMLQAFDIEGVEDQRAAAMLSTFTNKMLTGTA
jgi:hypothetical protein